MLKWIGAFFFAALVAALVTVPYHVPVAPGVASAAAVAGYSNLTAVVLAVMLLCGCVAACWAAARALGTRSMQPEEGAGPYSRLRAFELVAVFATVSFVYFPWALARTGPFTEDSFFLSILLRMQAGQQPYVDFEFPYGPLMIWLPYTWWRALGASAAAYYGYVAVVEAIKFTLIAAVLQVHFKDWRTRLTAFGLMAPLLANVLVGPNYNGFRQIPAAAILMLIAWRPWSLRAVAGSGLASGVLLAYSHEFGLACLAAVGGIYALLGWRGLGRLAAYLAVALTTWTAIAFAILGASFPVYVASARELGGLYTSGEFAFPFYWTLNSLAIFGLLVLACCAAGTGLARRAREMAAGDLFLLAAITYSLVALNSGLSRCDVWHLTTPVFVIAVAFVLPMPRRVFLIAPMRRPAWLIIAIISVTSLVGMAPAASHVFTNWARGLKMILSGTPQRLAPELASLRDYLAVANRPVVFYWETWVLDKRIGTPNRAYNTASAMPSDAAGLRTRDFLIQHPEALVVIDRYTYQHGRPETSGYYSPTLVKSVASWLSTVHFRVIESEILAQAERWERTLGVYVRANYAPVSSTGTYIVLGARGRP